MVWPVNKEPVDQDLLLEDPPVEDQLKASWDTLQGTEPVPKEIPRMSQDELRAFVQDVLATHIFVSDQVKRNEDIGLVFLPVAFGAFSEWDKEDLKQIGVIWAYNNEALPRSCNGYPMFTACHYMHVEDWKRARLAIVREQRRQQEIEV
jgi:hypothetical protein